MKEWAARFAEASDADPVIAAMARNFTCSYMYDMGGSKAIIDMIDGKIHRINISPAPMDGYDFALRACSATWREFAKAVPRPGYQGIFAASAAQDLKIEGNVATLMRHLRNITRQFELLRTVGVPA